MMIRWEGKEGLDLVRLTHSVFCNPPILHSDFIGTMEGKQPAIPSPSWPEPKPVAQGRLLDNVPQ